MANDQQRWKALAAEYKNVRKAAIEALTAVKSSYGSVEDGTYGNPTDVQLQTWEQARTNLENARLQVEAYFAEDLLEETTSQNLRWRLGLTRPLL